MDKKCKIYYLLFGRKLGPLGHLHLFLNLFKSKQQQQQNGINDNVFNFQMTKPHSVKKKRILLCDFKF